MDDLEKYGKPFKMSHDIKDYIKIYNVFTKEFCNSVVEGLDHDKWVVHKFYNYSENSYNSYDFDLANTDQYDRALNKEIMEKLWHVIKRYIDELEMPYFQGWNGFSQIKYNKYEVGKAMYLHHDGIKSLFDGERKGDPTLTILGVFNDDYKGGEFIICDNYELKLKQGDVVVFPSNFLYPHKVLPVTEGVRYSYVSWAW